MGTGPQTRRRAEAREQELRSREREWSLARQNVVQKKEEILAEIGQVQKQKEAYRAQLENIDREIAALQKEQEALEQLLKESQEKAKEQAHTREEVSEKITGIAHSSRPSRPGDHKLGTKLASHAERNQAGHRSKRNGRRGTGGARRPSGE